MRRFVLVVLVVAVVLVVGFAVLAWTGVKYAYEPSRDNVLSRTRPSPEPWDLWGHTYTDADAAREHLSPDKGAVKVDAAMLALGRKEFYKETFGNELFLTDVVGILNGPLRITNVSKAVLALHGRATTNLRVEVPETVTIGGHTFAKGSYLDTGLDVAAGALVPLGMSISVSRWHVRAGITCSLCHATVDTQTGKVVEGAPNQDLNAGLLIALGTNSSAFFMHTDVMPLRDVPSISGSTVKTSTGAAQRVPSAPALEEAVDRALLMWPRGNFDSLTDMKADPTQNPSSFTWGNHPYGWSGNFMAGPFHGLTSQNNNVHALNSDSLLLADSSPVLFDMDKEVYLALLLRNAPDKHYRWIPASGRSPSEFLQSVASVGSPGLNQVVLPPTYPKGTILSPDGTLTSSPGFKVWEQNNAMAAWQDTIVPPRARVETTPEIQRVGRQVFERAHCDSCHSGPFLSNNRVVPSNDLAVNPIRGQALAKTESNWTLPVLYSFSTPVPLPPQPRQLPVPVTAFDPQQIDLAWAHNGSGGGYKVPTLVGLFWTAPYLHDGGVAVGPDAERDLGLPGTVQRNVMPDPAHSLRAMVDRGLRARVAAANAASPDLQRMNVQGVGHNFWVDQESGFTAEEQRALILYLLSYEPGS